MRAYDAAGNASKDAKAKVKIAAAKTASFSGKAIADADYIAAPASADYSLEYPTSSAPVYSGSTLDVPEVLTYSNVAAPESSSAAAALEASGDILDSKNKGMLA